MPGKTKTTRKSPEDPAKNYKIGDRRKGVDGNQWIVTKPGKNFRWVRYVKKADCDEKKGMRFYKTGSPPCRAKPTKTTTNKKSAAKPPAKKVGRKAPAVSAKECNFGDKKKGLDGKTWIVVHYKKTLKRWARYYTKAECEKRGLKLHKTGEPLCRKGRTAKKA